MLVRLRSLLLLPLLCCCATVTMANPEIADAIIIGAGVAGLVAARDLKASRPNWKVLVLESRGRAGGRLWTAELTQPVSHKKVKVDLGAMWIHGVTNNPLTAYTKSKGITTRADLQDSGVTYSASGKELTSSQEALLDKFYDAFEGFMEWYRDELSPANKCSLNLQTVRDAFLAGCKSNASYRAWAKANDCDVLSAKECDDINGAYKTWLYSKLNSELEQEYGAAFADMSLCYWDYDDELPGDDALVLNYGDVTTKLLADVNLGANLRYNTVVTKISYSDATVAANGNRVLITATSGGKTVAYAAGKVVVTVPLGVLKAGKIAFEPALPSAKQTAINRMKMGLLDKVALLFPPGAEFWETGEFWLNRLPPSTDLVGNWTEFINLKPFTGMPLLVAFQAAKPAWESEKEPSELATVNSALTALKKMYPNKNIPTADKIAYKRYFWGKDEHTLGSYSFLAAGSVPSDRDALRQPMSAKGAKRVFFAGEATHAEYPATVHGAWLSGVAAAKAAIS